MTAEVLGEGARAVLDYRVAVETGAAMLAAERAAAVALDRLSEQTERMDAASAFEDYRRADVRFHIGVAEATRSARLVAAMTEVQGQMSDMIAQIAHPQRGAARRSNEQHRGLVAALCPTATAPRRACSPASTSREPSTSSRAFCLRRATR